MLLFANGAISWTMVLIILHQIPKHVDCLNKTVSEKKHYNNK